MQVSPVSAAFRARFPDSTVDWLTRSDFAELLLNVPNLNEIFAFDRKLGFLPLIRLAWRLSERPYTHIYDAHNNLRSRLVCGIFKIRGFLKISQGKKPPALIRRSKERLKRFLLFKFRRNLLPSPYRGSDSFLWPLQAWEISSKQPGGAQFRSRAETMEGVLNKLGAELSTLKRPWVIACPSAAWEMKRWPVNHWIKLIKKLPESIIFLGGNEDLFINELSEVAPERTRNFAGRLSLLESSALIELSDLVISADTGLLHVADQMEKPALALIGPTAFGYPSRATSEVLEIELHCKPCSKDGRGMCRNELYQRCMIDITPEKVAERAREKLKMSESPRIT